jgi:hypothetical protein
MADVFISYSSEDESLALRVHQFLLSERVTPFLAKISIIPGAEWEPAIRKELINSPWVVFLASHASCASSFVQQELGGAWLTGKQILPVVWNMQAAELPGFLKKYEALDLRNRTLEDLRLEIARIAKSIRADRLVGGLLLAALAGGVLWATSKS